jgi:hypothetical protein
MNKILQAIDIFIAASVAAQSPKMPSQPNSESVDASGQVLEVGIGGVYRRKQADWPDEEQRWMGEEKVKFFEKAQSML